MVCVRRHMRAARAVCAIYILGNYYAVLLTHTSHKAAHTRLTQGGGCKVGLHTQQQPILTTTHARCGTGRLRLCALTKKHTIMKKTVIRLITLTKWALVGAALFAAFAWAGKSDYVDSTVVEMKNNGTYYALSERFPDYSDADLVRYYVEHCK